MLLLILATFLLLALLLAGVVRRVPQGQVWSLHRFGRPVRMLGPGTRLVLPLVDRVGHKISLHGRVLRVAADPARPGNALLIYWQVLEPDRADAVIGNAEELLGQAARRALDEARDADRGSATGQRAWIKQALNQHLRARGMLVTRVELQLATSSS